MKNKIGLHTFMAVPAFALYAVFFIYPLVRGIGMSLIAVGAGILLTMLLVFVISKIFPAAFCKTADWVSGLFHKKGGKKG